MRALGNVWGVLQLYTDAAYNSIKAGSPSRPPHGSSAH